MDDCCRLVLPYNAVHSIQQTKQIPNDPPRMGAKSTTTSNHPSTPLNVDKVIMEHKTPDDDEAAMKLTTMDEDLI